MQDHAFFRKWLAMPILFLIVWGCNDNDPRPVLYYDSSDPLGTITRNIIKANLSQAGLGADVTYDVAYFRFRYKTEWQGKPLIASGIAALPVTDDPLPILSVHHGTIIEHASAPSVSTQSQVALGYFASYGYIMAIPDYLGFGTSEAVFHPYYVSEAYAVAIRDMIRAMEEFHVLEGGSFNGDVFLAGYSEGGYATMAVHKSMEEDPMDGFNLVASAPAAGGYDLKHFQEYYFGLETYPNPFYMAYIGASYFDNHFLNSDLTDYFKQPYADAIPELLSGEFDAGYVNNNLPKTVADLLQPGFLTGIDTDPAYSEMKDALALNDLSNWVPEKPMYLYHGDADITVPYANSVQTYNKMIANGTSPDILKLITLDGENHTGGYVPYVFDVIGVFQGLR